jgi:hypothetical protein
MRSRVWFPVLPWGFFREGEDYHADHGLGNLVELHTHISPSTSSGQRNCASWASQTQKSVTLRPQPGGKTIKSIRGMWWHWGEKLSNSSTAWVDRDTELLVENSLWIWPLRKWTSAIIVVSAENVNWLGKCLWCETTAMKKCTFGRGPSQSPHVLFRSCYGTVYPDQHPLAVLRLSLLCCVGVLCSEVSRCAVGWVVSDVSKDRGFLSRQGSSSWPVKTRATTIFWNGRAYSPKTRHIP